MDNYEAHQTGHKFVDHMSKKQTDSKMAWKGTLSGEETWIDYTLWMMAHFRDWALENNIPREHWAKIFNEVMMD